MERAMKKLFAIPALLLAFGTAQAASVSKNCTFQYNNGSEVKTDQCHKYNFSEGVAGSFVLSLASDNHVVIFISKNSNVRNEKNYKYMHVDGVAVADMSHKILKKEEVSGFCKVQPNQAFECEAGDFMGNGTIP